MTILCLGLSHQTTPLELRERLAYDTADLQDTLTLFTQKARFWAQPLQELAILSTCNRVELYATSTGTVASAFEHLLACLAETRQLSAQTLRPYLYHHQGLAAGQHLCRVAAGLESLVLGESQILGQVAAGHAAAQKQGAIKAGLGELFRTALRTGKRARYETGIDRNPASIGSMAVRLAQQVVDDLSQAQVLIVGAGQMAELALESLTKRGVQSITIANRTAQHAADLAARWGGQVRAWADLPQALAEANIIITSTGSPEPIITHDMGQKARSGRDSQSLVLIDIAVPRDVDPTVGALPRVHLFDIDDLQTHLQAALSQRQAEIPKVEAIVAEEMATFEARLRETEISPLITALRHQAEAIRQRELERTLRYLPDLDPETSKHIQHLSRTLVNKLLHEPTHRLRVEASQGQGTAYAEIVRHLFGLNVGEQPQ